MTITRLTLDQMNDMAVKALVTYFNKRNSGNAAVALINVWKASKAKLIEKIAATDAALDDPIPDARPRFVKANEATKVAVKGEKETSAKVERKPRELGVVGDFAKAHSLNPKVLRASLRRAGLNAPYTVAQLEKLLK